MGLSVTTTIFLFVVCLCGGIAIGAIFSRIKKTPSPPKPADVEKEIEQPEAVPEPVSLAQEGDTEILRAWKTGSGGVWLEMDGQRLENKESMQPDQKKRLVNLVLELRPWLNIPPAPQPAPATPAVQRQPVIPPVGRQAGARQVSPPPVSSEPQFIKKSMVEQIDDVLQKNIAGTIFADQDIHLLDGPGGTVIAQVGNERFEGVESVTNPEIKGLIKLAVAEWEKITR